MPTKKESILLEVDPIGWHDLFKKFELDARIAHGLEGLTIQDLAYASVELFRNRIFPNQGEFPGIYNPGPEPLNDESEASNMSA